MINDIDWESVGYFIFFSTLIFIGSILMGALGATIILLLKWAVQ